MVALAIDLRVGLVSKILISFGNLHYIQLFNCPLFRFVVNDLCVPTETVELYMVAAMYVTLCYSFTHRQNVIVFRMG